MGSTKRNAKLEFRNSKQILNIKGGSKRRAVCGILREEERRAENIRGCPASGRALNRRGRRAEAPPTLSAENCLTWQLHYLASLLNINY
jgi:hypothetical protein